MKTRSLLSAAALSAALSTAACQSGVDWTRHLSLRAYGSGVRLSEVDPTEPAKAAVRPQLDYVAISVERVYFKGVPSALTGAVAVGLEVQGIAPGTDPVKTVLGVKDIGPGGEVRFDEMIALQPTLYTGREVQITLHFRRMPAQHKQAALGRVQGSWDLLRKLDPALASTLAQPLSIFQQVIDGPATVREPTWTYSVRFVPMNVAQSSPERVFSAARHILIMLPPKDTAGAWGKLRTSDLPRYLKVENGRLFWRHTGREYEATPHIILNVRRYRRYPRENEVDKFLRRADVLYEQGNQQGFFLLGRIALMSASESLVGDKILTVQEKNLTREWITFRHRRYDADEAGARGDKKGQLEHMYSQIRSLGVIRKEFPRVLYPYEVKDIEYKVTSLAVKSQMLAKELGEPEAKLDELLNAYDLKERVVELTKVKFKDRVIRVMTPQAEQFGAPEGDPSVASAGAPDPKLVDIAAAALAQPLNQNDLEEGVTQPFYKKWWFWTLVGGAVLGGAAGAYFGMKSDFRGGSSVTGPFVPLGRP